MHEKESIGYGITDVLSNIVWKILERGSSVVVTLLVNVILARLLAPEEHGLLAMVLVFVTISEIFVTAGMNAALTQKREADELDFSSMFWLNIVVSSVIYLLIFMLSPVISLFLGYAELTLILRVLGIRIIIAAVNSIQCAYVARNMLFKFYFSSTLLGKVLSGVIGICLALLNAGVWALVAQTVSVLLIETVILWLAVKWRPKVLFSWKRIRLLYPFVWKVTLTNFIENITDQVRNLMLGRKYTSSDLAFYNKGILFPNTLTCNVASAVSTVVFPVMSKQQDNIVNVKKICRNWIGFFCFSVFPMLVGMTMISSELVTLLFTRKWLGVVPFMQIACGIYSAWIVEVPIREAIRSVGRADIGLRMQIIKMVISIIILVITIKFGAIMIAFGSFISAMLNIGISMCYGRRYLNYRFREVIADILPTMILSIGMGFVVALSAKVVEPNVWGLVVRIVIGIVVYVGGAVLTHNRFLTIGISYSVKMKLRKSTKGV